MKEALKKWGIGLLAAIAMVALLMTASAPLRAQLIYGNTFPFWNVTGPFSVTTGPSTITGGLTVDTLTTTGAQTQTGNMTITGVLNPAGGLSGVTSSSVAAVGIVGEQVTGGVTLASAVALSTGQQKGGACATFGAGDWDVQGTTAFSGSAATITETNAWLNTNAASTTFPTVGQFTTARNNATAVTGGSAVVQTTPVVPFNLNTSTVLCTGGSITFAAGSAAIYGAINGRRRR